MKVKASKSFTKILEGKALDLKQKKNPQNKSTN